MLIQMMGDIGKHFPDNDPKYKGIDSSELVNIVVDELDKKNYIVGNIDSTIILEKPKLSTHIPEMQKNVSNLLNITLENVNIKATTNEGMGYIGRGEGIAAYVSLILIHKN